MSADPRAALSTLMLAFERHLEASSTRRGEDDPTVIAAYDDLADAFALYDDSLLQAFGEMTPLDIYDGPDDDDDDDDDDADDDDDDDDDGDDEEAGDDAVYTGLDDDYEVEEPDRA